MSAQVIEVGEKLIVIESLEYRMVNNRLVITDNRDFSLDINEFGSVV